uniref:Uncharacterized protein n=1 Tax=Anguilla anguilla TaxID=7936 RepID=A0A0E9R3P3_ANGAN
MPDSWSISNKNYTADHLVSYKLLPSWLQHQY